MAVSWDFIGIYPLVNVYMSVERSTIFDGKTHHFYGHIFCYVSHYQRVKGRCDPKPKLKVASHSFASATRWQYLFWWNGIEMWFLPGFEAAKVMKESECVSHNALEQLASSAAAKQCVCVCVWAAKFGTSLGVRWLEFHKSSYIHRSQVETQYQESAALRGALSNLITTAVSL